MEPISFVFDESSPQWGKNFKFKAYFVLSQENYFNHLLQARGHVFLNEVYDAFGVPRTTLGQLVGWIGRDSKIEFGFPDQADFDEAVTITFNVHGSIYQDIENV